MRRLSVLLATAMLVTACGSQPGDVITTGSTNTAPDRTVETTFKLIEPILLVVMAVVVGFIVFALFMPLLQMMQQMSKR